MRHVIWILLLVAGIVIADEPAKEPEKIPAVEGEKKAEEPKAEESKAERKLGQVSPEAGPLLEKLAAAYASLKSLKLEGSASLISQEEGAAERAKKETFTSFFQAPVKFRHEMSNQPLLGSNGDHVYGYSSLNNVYVMFDAPKEKTTLDKLPADHAQIIPIQNLSLALALARDPAQELMATASQISKGDDQEIDGKKFSSLKLVLNDEQKPMTLWIDPQTNLIRRYEVNFLPTLHKLGHTQFKAASFLVNYTGVVPNAEFKPEQFAWEPPLGARDMVALRKSMEEEMGGEMLALVGKPAPDFTLETLDGKKVTLSDLKGSVVVLDFWATWCGPCIISLPKLQKLDKEFEKDGVKIFAVNQAETKDKVLTFMNERKLELTVLLDPEGQVNMQYKADILPSSAVIDKDGIIRKVIIGYIPAEAEGTMRTAIQQVLQMPAEQAKK